MRKLFWLAVIVVVLAAGGYYGLQYGREYVADQVMDRVVEEVMRDERVRELLDDPEVRKAIREAAAAEDLEQLSRELQSGTAEAGGDGAGAPPLVVRNVDEAEALVLEKFSISEIREYAGMAQDGLTDEEKAALQSEVLGQFTEEELHALKVVALLEAEKRLNAP